MPVLYRLVLWGETAAPCPKVSLNGQDLGRIVQDISPRLLLSDVAVRPETRISRAGLRYGQRVEVSVNVTPLARSAPDQTDVQPHWTFKLEAVASVWMLEDNAATFLEVDVDEVSLRVE